MDKQLDGAMQRLDSAVAACTTASADDHQTLIDAFAAVAIELRWDGFAAAKSAAPKKPRTQLRPPA